jgi:predicted TIM-barrel fold metal-dependent hydrolase
MNLIHDFNLDRNMVVEWLRFIERFIEPWPDYMFDYLKLRNAFGNNNNIIDTPFVSISPAIGINYVKSKLGELNDLINGGLLILGLVFAPTIQAFNPSRNKAFKILLEYAERNNLIVVMHLGPWFLYNDYLKDLMPTTILDTLSRYNLTVVISLIGLDDKPAILTKWFDDFLHVKHPRISKYYIETAGINCFLVNTNLGSMVINRLGTDNLIFATGYPFYRFNKVLNEINCINNAPLSKTDKENILINNVLSLIRQ